MHLYRFIRHRSQILGLSGLVLGVSWLPAPVFKADNLKITRSTPTRLEMMTRWNCRSSHPRRDIAGAVAPRAWG